MGLIARILKLFGKEGRLSYNLIHYDHVVLAFLAVLIGLLSAYGAIAFRWVITNVKLYTFQSDNFLTIPEEMAWWRILLIPILGGLFVGVLMKFFTHLQRPSAVADVIAANALDDGKINVKEGLVSALATAVSLGVGASAGREGPVVHLGATLSSFISQKLNLAPAVGRTLLACGVASAVASSFNAPIAGVFFALEVVMGHYAIHAFAPVVIASVAGTMITRIHLGDFPAFIVPDLVIASPFEFPAFLLLGVVSALCGMFFMQSLVFAENKVNKLSIPPWVLPAFGGLFVGIIGLFYPEIFGVGYEATDNALKENYDFSFLITLIFIKILATAISYGFRFGGGVFSPSLYLGAMTGGAFGTLISTVYTGESSTIAVYTIVGMGAVASSVLGAPISTMLIVFELTGDYSITIAVMMASAVASLTSGLMHKTSFFYWQLERRGIHLEDGRAKHLLKTMSVNEVMDRDFTSIPKKTSLKKVKEYFIKKPTIRLLVCDDKGGLFGVISPTDLNNEIFKSDQEGQKIAGTICHQDLLFVKGEQSLESTLEIMETSGHDHIPVVNHEASRIPIGIAHYRAVISFYNHALTETQDEIKGIKKDVKK